MVWPMINTPFYKSMRTATIKYRDTGYKYIYKVMAVNIAHVCIHQREIEKE